MARIQCTGAVLTALLCAAPAAAQQPGAAAPAEEPSEEPASGELKADLLARYQRLSRPLGGYGRILASLAFGRGLRFNNPYRLRTQLGDTGESLSLTAPYLDAWLALGFGPPDGVQHGGTLHLSVALEGVSQQVMTPGYLMIYRGAEPLLVHGRLGAAVIITPDPNVGPELGAGLVYFLSGVVGLSVELIGSLFYGAATYESAYTVIPILSAQAGLAVDIEVLP